MKEILCVRCGIEMEYLKECVLDTKECKAWENACFSGEEHFVFDVYVCPKCKHTELLYRGRRQELDNWNEW